MSPAVKSWLDALDKTEDAAIRAAGPLGMLTTGTATVLIIRAMNQATQAIIAAVEGAK